MNRFSKRFYRDKFNAKFMGVCAGLADYFEIDALWIRLAFIVLLFVTGFVIAPIYFLIALITDGKPMHLYDEDNFEDIFSDGPDMPKPASRKESDQ